MVLRADSLSQTNAEPDPESPMAVHASRETYFAALHADPYGLENPHYNWSGENRFVAWAASMAAVVVATIACLQALGIAAPISGYTYALFVAWIFVEIAGKLIFSWAILRFNIKINYVRKLALRPWRKLKSYVIPLMLVGIFGLEKGGNSSIIAVVMLTSLDVLKTIVTEWNVIRRKVPILKRAFLAWDRLEDRPYTLRFDVLEDVLRFIVYLPFICIFGKEALLIMIPQLINEFGDGLAEPVGIRFGKHKYRTRSLWYNGKFWNGNFERSLEGSAAVFVVSIITLFIFREQLDPTAFWILIGILPISMTVAEAVSPHTNDGPALALVGCWLIWLVTYFFPLAVHSV